jgi:Low affinity iron permease
MSDKSFPVSRAFSTAANQVAKAAGRPICFAAAAFTVVVWAAFGPIFHYSDTWQLVINTGTTIVTFLMVFLIQNSQNRDNAAIQVKLDELIRAGAWCSMQPRGDQPARQMQVAKGLERVFLVLAEVENRDCRSGALRRRWGRGNGRTGECKQYTSN